jgi:hypothetical protein
MFHKKGRIVKNKKKNKSLSSRDAMLYKLEGVRFESFLTFARKAFIIFG